MKERYDSNKQKYKNTNKQVIFSDMTDKILFIFFINYPPKMPVPYCNDGTVLIY